MDCPRRICVTCDQNFGKVLVIYKISSDVALNSSINIIQHILRKSNIKKIYVEDDCYLNYASLTKEKNYDKIRKVSSLEEISKKYLDLCIIIGGDGTLLWANSLFKTNCRPPFLTFNLGTLGYMTYYNCERYVEVLDELLDDRKCNVILEKRSTLLCKFVSEDHLEEQNEEIIALNDIVIDRGPNPHLINIEVYINNEPLTKVSGDGVLMSSSTGSTAYSLSAGGTIVHYDVDCLLLNAICPHSLSFRPIAFPNSIELKVLVCENSHSGYVNYDGIKRVLRKPKQGVIVKVSDITVNLILLEKFTENPVKVWKQKLINQLGWNKAFVNDK